MRVLIIIFGKLLIGILKLFGSSGSALPGLVVEKIYPRLLRRQLEQLDHGVVYVTGTNGKTSTTKALVHLVQKCGYRVLTNPHGSNMNRGIYSTLLKYSSLTGKLPYDVAIFELDEAFSAVLSKEFQPHYVLALNVMRDQLDRYGEIDKTAEYISQAVSSAQRGVVLNSDDDRVANMSTKAIKKYFGVDGHLRQLLPTDDELHDEESEFAHGQHKQSVTLADYRPGKAKFRFDKQEISVDLNVSGLHNAVNITAALAMANMVCKRIEPKSLVPMVSTIPPAFGRGETIEIDGKKITLALVKNPAGFRQSLLSYSKDTFDVLLFSINDKFADGRDVSWLWDVSFKDLPQYKKIYTSGTRAKDMSLRLSYDEHEVEYSEEELEIALDKLIEDTNKHSLVFCTYTSMLALRKLASKYVELEDIW